MAIGAALIAVLGASCTPPCAADACQSKVCADGKCAAPTCSDGVQNGNETGSDCGGHCAGCPTGGGCSSPGDCAAPANAVAPCTGGTCQAPGCTPGFGDCNGDPADG